MKKLTLEEKAARYDEAIEIARDYHSVDIDNTMHIKARGIMEYLFPELTESDDESDDERIRKECISIIDTWDKSCRLQGDYCEVAPECIAWLEKQSEQKSNANCILNWSEIDEKCSKVLKVS